MESSGTTLLSQHFLQERVVRNSPSPNSWAVETHIVTTDGSGDATITTCLDEIVFMVGGIDGTTAADAPALNHTGTAVAGTDTYTYAVKGAASTKYNIMVFGNFRGS